MTHEEWTNFFVASLRNLWIAQEVDIFVHEIIVKIKTTVSCHDELLTQVKSFNRIEKKFNLGLTNLKESEPIYLRIDTAIFSILAGIRAADIVVQEEHENQEVFQRSVKEYSHNPKRPF